MVDMKRSIEEKLETATPSPASLPDYPYGLCISLCEDDLEKLDLDTDGVQIGDMIHMHCMATVKSISKSDNALSGPSCRIELQITHIATENEDEENEAPAPKPKRDVPSKLYTQR